MKPQKIVQNFFRDTEELARLLDQVPGSSGGNLAIVQQRRQEFAGMLSVTDDLFSDDLCHLLAQLPESLDFAAVDKWLKKVPSANWQTGKARQWYTELEDRLRLIKTLRYYRDHPRYGVSPDPKWYTLIEDFAQLFDGLPESEGDNFKTVGHIRQQLEAKGKDQFTINCKAEAELDYESVDQWLMTIPDARWRLGRSARLMAKPNPDPLRKVIEDWLPHPRYGNPADPLATAVAANPVVPPEPTEAPPNAFRLGEWWISDGLACYRKQQFTVRNVSRLLLEHLVKAKGNPVSFRQLKGACGNETMEDSTLRGYISDLRKTIRESLNRPKPFDPIPKADKSAYKLDLWP